MTDFTEVAKARYRESLGRLRAFSSPTYIAWCLEGCAAATNLRKQADTPLPHNEHEALERVDAMGRALLGQQAFRQEYAVGAGLTQNEVFDVSFPPCNPKRYRRTYIFM